LYELLTAQTPFSGETPVEIAMKHLTEVPEPPSDLRPEVPEDLDLVVLRSLAKEPGERYPSAAAMDADLETVAHGGHVPPETADAATMVLAGARSGDGSTAVTQVVPRPRRPGGPPPPPPPSRGRVIWPWLLGIGAVLALLAAGYIVYDIVRDQLAAAKPVAVPYVVGIERALAVNEIRDRDLEARVQNVPNSDVQEGLVFQQSPAAGTKVEKETVVTIRVSSGAPEVTVPSVVGQSETDAVEELTRAGLDAQVVEVNSDKEQGTVTAQDPAGGLVVVEGTPVRINVSRGPKPVTVPNVVGIPYDQAAAELRRQGFDVARADVDSDLAEGIVVSQSPGGGSSSEKGATVTLSVSRGPETSAVPEVTTFDASAAESTLGAAGFRVQIVYENTDDPTLDGVVISQDPLAGTPAEPNSVVTIFVGRYVAPSTDTTPFP
jgi:serine/threonine-protein kinase